MKINYEETKNQFDNVYSDIKKLNLTDHQVYQIEKTMYSRLLLLRMQSYGFEFNGDELPAYEYVQRLSQYEKIMNIGRYHPPEITWEDNGKEPDNETLYVVSFCEGAYIFGKNYYFHIFNDFFDELKTYNYKYIDSNNRSLYFTLEEGVKLHKELKAILKKYKNRYVTENKKLEVERLKEEIKRLES